MAGGQLGRRGWGLGLFCSAGLRLSESGAGWPSRPPQDSRVPGLELGAGQAEVGGGSASGSLQLVTSGG